MALCASCLGRPLHHIKHFTVANSQQREASGIQRELSGPCMSGLSGRTIGHETRQTAAANPTPVRGVWGEGSRKPFIPVDQI